MADPTTIYSGTTGDPIDVATDEVIDADIDAVNPVKFQYVKLVSGDPDDTTKLGGGNPIPTGPVLSDTSSVTWTDATALDTALTLDVSRAASVNIESVDTSTELTDGAIAFEGLIDTLWVLVPGILTTLTGATTPVRQVGFFGVPADNTCAIRVDVAAYSQFRIRLKTQLTGTAPEVTITARTSTAPVSDPVRTGEDQAVRITSDTPLPVAVGTVVVDDGGGSLTVDGAVIVDDGGGSITVDDGSGSLTVDGAVSVDDGGGSLTVDGTVIVDDGAGSITVDNGGTFPVQAAQSGTWNVGTVTTVTNVVHVDDNSGTLSIDDGAGSITVDGTVAVSGTVTVDSELTTADLDTGAGTDTRAVVGMALAESGGAVLVGSAHPVPVSDNSGSLTVDNGGTFAVQASQTGTWNVATVTTVTGVTNVVHVDDNSSTLSIDDGSGSITVDGSITADTELTTADLDTGAGTDTRAVVGLVYGASGGAVIVSTTNPMPVGDNSGSLTVDGTITANAGTGNFATNTAQVGGSTVSAAATGVQKVGVVGSAGGIFDAATAATAPANALQVGSNATSTTPAAATAGNMVAALIDTLGRMVVMPYALSDSLLSGTADNMTGTASTQILAAPAANIRNYVTWIHIVNEHASVDTDVQILDGNAGSELFRTFAAHGGGGITLALPTPLKQTTTATRLDVKCVTTGSNTTVSLGGFKGP